MLILPLLPRQNARQAQETAQCRVIVSRPPHRAELKCGVTTGNRPECHPWKGRDDRGLTGEAHTPSHPDKMHHGFSADIDLLDSWCLSSIGKVFDHAFAKCRAPFGLAENEVLVAESLPFDCLSVTERMVVRQRHKQALMPERSDVAIGRFTRICHKRHVKMALSNERNLFRRSPFDKSHGHVGMLRGIAPYQLPKKASRDRRTDANAQLSGCAPARGLCNPGCLVKLVKRIARLLKESNAGVGNSHAGGIPFEQRHAEFVFERPHSAAQNRLPNAQRLCGASEAQMLSDSERLRNRNRINPR
jgi:hypothetical protein